MRPEEASAALADIRRRGEQSRAEYLRYGRSLPVLLLAALLVFLGFASFDLPDPWGGAMLIPALGLLAALAFLLRRAPVRKEMTTREALYATAFGLGLVAVFQGLSQVAQAGGAPAPHSVSAALVCVACVFLARRAGARCGRTTRAARRRGKGLMDAD